MKPLFKVGQTVWTKERHQWIRVVVVFVYEVHAEHHHQQYVVRPLFPGDSIGDKWCAIEEHLQAEEPSFDQIDATYDGDEEMEFA